MNGTTLTAYKIGDLFTVNPDLYPAGTRGVVYQVTKVPVGRNGKNYTGTPVVHTDDGWTPVPGRGVRAPAHLMTRHDPDTAPTVTTVSIEDILALPDVGALVQVETHGKMPAGLYVVTGYPKGTDTSVRLVKLGGDGGRYWPKVPAAWCTVIDPDRVTVQEA